LRRRRRGSIGSTCGSSATILCVTAKWGRWKGWVQPAKAFCTLKCVQRVSESVRCDGYERGSTRKVTREQGRWRRLARRGITRNSLRKHAVGYRAHRVATAGWRLLVVAQRPGQQSCIVAYRIVSYSIVSYRHDIVYRPEPSYGSFALPPHRASPPTLPLAQHVSTSLRTRAPVHKWGPARRILTISSPLMARASIKTRDPRPCFDSYRRIIRPSPQSPPTLAELRLRLYWSKPVGVVPLPKLKTLNPDARGVSLPPPEAYAPKPPKPLALFPLPLPGPGNPKAEPAEALPPSPSEGVADSYVKLEKLWV